LSVSNIAVVILKRVQNNALSVSNIAVVIPR